METNSKQQTAEQKKKQIEREIAERRKVTDVDLHLNNPHVFPMFYKKAEVKNKPDEIIVDFSHNKEVKVGTSVYFYGFYEVVEVIEKRKAAGTWENRETRFLFLPRKIKS